MKLNDVRNLKFSHDSIGQNFTHGPHGGTPLATLTAELVSKKIDPITITPLVAISYQDVLYTVCGNRRLRACHDALDKGLEVCCVRCIVFPIERLEELECLRGQVVPVVCKFLSAFSTLSSGGLAPIRENGPHSSRPVSSPSWVTTRILLATAQQSGRPALAPKRLASASAKRVVIGAKPA